MMWKQLIIAGLSTMGMALAFSPSRNAWNTRARTASRSLQSRRSLSMLVQAQGADAFGEIQEKASKGSKIIKGLPPPLATAVINGLPAVAGAAALALSSAVVPAPVMAVAAYGGSLLGSAGRRKLVPERDAAAKVELAALLESDFGAVSPSAVAAVQAQFALPDQVFEDIKIDIFAEFVLCMLKNPEFKTAELRELAGLAEVLGLGPEATGDGFFAAVEETWKRQVQWTSSSDLEDPESLERMTVDKCLFLAARTMEDMDTAEGVAYTKGRITELMQLDPGELDARIIALATPLYKQALDTVLAKLEKVTSENVKKARGALGLSVATTAAMHEDVYVNEVVSIMEKSDFKMGAEGVARLAKLADVLGIEEERATELRMEEVVPVFEYDLNEIMNRMLEDPAAGTEGCVAELAMRQNDLSLGSAASQGLVLKALARTVAEPFTQATEFLKLRNTKAALGAMQAVLQAKEVAAMMCDALVENNMMEEGVAESFYEMALPKVDSKTADGLYSLLLKDTLQANDEALSASVSELEEMMGLDEASKDAIFADVVGPVLRAKLTSALDADATVLNAEARQAAVEDKDAFLEANRVPEKVMADLASALYKERLGAATAGAKIMTAAEREKLDAQREYLGLSLEVRDKLHRSATAPAYQQAVAEAMVAGAGVLKPEYREGLDKLGDRFLLSAIDRRTLETMAFQERLAPMVAKLVSVFEQSVLTKEQLAQRQGKDLGEDLNVDPGAKEGLGLEAAANLLAEVGNLVDFFEGNALWEEAGGAGSGKYVYATTCKGVGEVDPKLMLELYRQASVQLLQAGADPALAASKKQRYELAKVHLGAILGLDEDEAGKVKGEIGTTVYEQTAKAALARSGTLEAADLQQLVQIQQTLGMEEDRAMDLLWGLKKGYLLSVVRRAQQQIELSGPLLASVKAAAEKVGVDLAEDLGLTVPEKLQFFLADAVALLKAGEVTAADPSALLGAQEDWGVEDDVANREFEAFAQTKVTAAAGLAEAAVARADDGAAAAALDTVLQFCSLLPDVKAEVQSENTKAKLVSLFTASVADFETGLSAEDQAKVEVLKAALVV